MVWGMSLPSGFGEFWPSGAFEYDAKTRESGWSERLRLYYLDQTPEEQKRLFDYQDAVGRAAHFYGGYVSGKFISELGTGGGAERPHFNAIEPHEPPQSFDTEKTYKTLGSLIGLNSQLLAVDDNLKAIMERLEPGVHQFFPIKITMPRGAVFPKPYYVLVISQYIDSFSPENSNPDSWHDWPDYPDFYYYYHREDKRGITGLALSKMLFGRAHFWRERRFNGILICFSDELQAEVVNAGLRMPKHYRMKEV
jgi:hypothetical protein